MKNLLITPPLTQLNTPYPATTVLKGCLDAHGHPTAQADLSGSRGWYNTWLIIVPTFGAAYRF